MALPTTDEIGREVSLNGFSSVNPNISASKKSGSHLGLKILQVDFLWAEAS